MKNKIKVWLKRYWLAEIIGTLYFSLSMFSNLQLGIIVGKVAADVLFYIPTIISYELRKKHLKD